MRMYIIEREVPGIGSKQDPEYCGIARQSQEVLDALGKGIQWQHSFVAADRTFCVYLAESEDLVRKHAEQSGFPANRIIEINRMIDPTTADAAVSTGSV